MTATTSQRRTRRFDPGRKDRLIDAALGVIAQHGVAGTTHRAVAAAADVPLGSLTYHFESLDDLHYQALSRHAQQGAAAYAEHFTGVRSAQDLLDAVTDVIVSAADGAERDWRITFELYLTALHSPELREITEGWMRASRAVLHRYVDAGTARALDALVEGLSLHKRLSNAPPSRAMVQDAVRRILQPAGRSPDQHATRSRTS